ncbi:UDP-N-acetylmuramoylalanyl-D-glutamyl-2,6-diaminopimelate--D-alanyl-D-alanine ligase [Alsobacter sp. SYSU M60028]|uniref:UDP-N-acetylmuramoyl-tripeptide--D-alanyl-D-alanine ligase n=1 Tax=Alsobacter ponti TaxID=2962936 RepID=A0ABT1L8A8_9HYPH|nr:UDP-N-acetylmuramoylalanyl-D-glutamyl-2,6-diaminopimelate--D-alanyl-D-alanine ligase [Alsobacter ponti]MCP8937176.1 UDP-N-acetylmuramoylalanyl-D-glutamyl-2,6-diaminopimelate--D-alanyl-D-alanine ligase [Alsobacter ponti]
MTTNSTLSRPADAAAPLWQPDDLLAAMGARADGAPLREVTGVSIDTRTLQPGDLFFAIRGEARDGHDFVPAALARGAAAAVVAEDRAAEFRELGPLCAVPDVLDALVALGLAARARTGARIAAITGSVGKTGTKEALRAVLAAQGPTHASAASYNNHWGVPLTLARMPSASRFGVFEIGMNHAGEITPLTGMVRPHVAAITTVEPVHLENLGSIEAIADAKAEIFDGLEEGGVAVLPRDNPHFERLLRHAEASRATRIVTFGEHAEADVRLVGLAMKPDMSIVEASVHGSAVAYRLGSPGRHVALNSLCVLAVCAGLGADVTLAALALAHVRPPSGRGERIVLSAPGGDMALYDESYNANPASMRAALSILGQAPLGPGGRRVAVLGDMLELGPEGPALHAGLAPAIADAGVDVVFCAGPLMKNLFDALPAARRGAWASSASELEPAVVAAVRAGDAITVKGSNGSRTATIVAALKSRFAPPAS